MIHHLRQLISSDTGAINKRPEIYRTVKVRANGALLAQLCTGHCGLNYYLHHFKKKDEARCEQCKYDRETVEHFLLECLAYWRKRHEMRVKVGARGMWLATVLGDKDGIEVMI